MGTIPKIEVALGQLGELLFLLQPECVLFEMCEERFLSIVVSTFTGGMFSSGLSSSPVRRKRKGSSPCKLSPASILVLVVVIHLWGILGIISLQVGCRLILITIDIIVMSVPRMWLMTGISVTHSNHGKIKSSLH